MGIFIWFRGSIKHFKNETVVSEILKDHVNKDFRNKVTSSISRFNSPFISLELVFFENQSF